MRVEAAAWLRPPVVKPHSGRCRRRSMLRAERFVFLLFLLSFSSVIIYLAIVMRPASMAGQIAGEQYLFPPRREENYRLHPPKRLARMKEVASLVGEVYSAPVANTSEVQKIRLTTSTALDAGHRLDGGRGERAVARDPSPTTPSVTLRRATIRTPPPSSAVQQRRPRTRTSSRTTAFPPPPLFRSDGTSLGGRHPANDSPAERFVWPSEESPRCSMANCLDLLSRNDQLEIKKCKRNTLKHVVGPLAEPTCRFLRVPGHSREAVALNSQEGSGNTWLRGLLEKATGICTGFYGCDYEMRAHGFLGEGVKTANVLVVKTHVHIPQWAGERKRKQYEGSYGSAVFLVRNPARSAIAEWNRLYTAKHSYSQGAHTNVIPESEFKTKQWIEFFGRYLDRWKERIVNWVLTNKEHPVHVVNYEELQNNTVGEVEKILDFLHFPYNRSDLVERLRVDFTTFRRLHMNNGFQHFLPQQKQQLRETITNLLSMAKAARKADLFIFQRYLSDLAYIN